MSYLERLVLDKINSMDRPDAASFFEVDVDMVAGWEKWPAAIPVSAIEKVFDPDATPGALKAESLLWEGKKVCLSFPWYKTSNPKTVFSLLSLLDRTKMAAMLDYGDAFIAHSRNKLADGFLKSGVEWMLTVDDDMILPYGNAKGFRGFTNLKFPDKFAGLNTVDRLISHGKTLVGALYFGRWLHGKPVYAEGAESKAEEAWARQGPYDICKPTRWVGTGCLLIHRRVFLDIETKFPSLARGENGLGGQWFTSSEHDLKKATVESLAILRDDSTSAESRVAEVLKRLEHGTRFSGRNAGLGVGEDVIFCRRASQAGHQAHVDCGLICGHVGEYVYGP